MGDRRRQCGSEDLPGEEALGDKREGYVDPLAEEVVGPPTDLLVLQPLVDGEAVEEDEQREEDRVDEPGRVLVGPGANQVDPDGDPRDDAGQASDPEWPEPGAWTLVSLLHPAEADHRRVDADERDQRCDVADTDQHGDENDPVSYTHLTLPTNR